MDLDRLPQEVIRKIRRLHALLGSPHTGEAANARDLLIRLLAEHGLTWNDVPLILAEGVGGDAPHRHTADTPSHAPDCASDLDTDKTLDLLLALIEEHLSVTPAECMAIALWALHTHVYDRYDITPRLAFTSPVPECGKTTALLLLEQLVRHPLRADNMTPAAIYHTITENPQTSLLLDEGDNLDLFKTRLIRSALNSGHLRNGAFVRMDRGSARRLSTFAPVAIALIGDMPDPLRSRSIVIEMVRHARGGAPLKRVSELDPAFAATRELIDAWARTCQLESNPALPEELANRVADNWRVLLAIADDFGSGDDARAAAIELSTRRVKEAIGVLLLRDILSIFSDRRVDRVFSSDLVGDLIVMGDAPWPELLGSPRLAQGRLAKILAPFQIEPKTIWPLGGRSRRGKSKKGYLRADFERAWAAYCASGTRSHENNVRYSLAG